MTTKYIEFLKEYTISFNERKVLSSLQTLGYNGYRSPLYCAVLNDNVAQVEKLLKEGDDPNETFLYYYLDHKTKENYNYLACEISVLHASLRNQNVEILKLLLSYGVDLMYTFTEFTYDDDHFERNFYENALRYYKIINLDYFKILFSVPNVKEIEASLICPSFITVAISARQDIEFISILISQGFDINYVGISDNSLDIKNNLEILLGLVNNKKSTDMFALLLAAGVDTMLPSHLENQRDFHNEDSTDKFVMLGSIIPSNKNLLRQAVYHISKDILKLEPNTRKLSKEFKSLIRKQIPGAKKKIQMVGFNAIKHRALEICIAMKELDIDALNMSNIVIESCSPFAERLDYHYIWDLVVAVKHFPKL